jgi:serine/threonine protein kinase
VSLTLVEVCRYENLATVLVTDYVNGSDIWELMYTHRTTRLREVEAHLLYRKFAEAMQILGNNKITHRDIHINNVMLHFPTLELSDEELNSADIHEVLEAKMIDLDEIATDLTRLKPEDIQIKIIDFGFSRMVEEDGVMTTPCGVPMIKPPEMSGGDQDESVDSWNAGVLLYMMLTRTMMFDKIAG